MTLEKTQSLDHGNLIGQMSELRPTGPKSAKLNLTRIHEYTVLHLDEIQSSSEWKERPDLAVVKTQKSKIK